MYKFANTLQITSFPKSCCYSKFPCTLFRSRLAVVHRSFRLCPMHCHYHHPHCTAHVVPKTPNYVLPKPSCNTLSIMPEFTTCVRHFFNYARITVCVQGPCSSRHAGTSPNNSATTPDLPAPLLRHAQNSSNSCLPKLEPLHSFSRPVPCLCLRPLVSFPCSSSHCSSVERVSWSMVELHQLFANIYDLSLNSFLQQTRRLVLYMGHPIHKCVKLTCQMTHLFMKRCAYSWVSQPT